MRLVHIVAQNNPVLRKQELRFGKVKTDQTKLAILRKEYRLDDVISPGETEFEKFLLLKRWVRSRWNHGYDHTPIKPPPEVPMSYEVLKHAERGETFACGTYSRVFYECLLSLGYQARVLGIRCRGSDLPNARAGGGHNVTEIWSNEFQKWVVMDSDLNCYWEVDGVPLSALEVRKAWLQGQEDRVKLVLDEPYFVVPRKNPRHPEQTEEEFKRIFRIFRSRKSMPYFHYIKILDNTLDMPVTRWVDKYSLPQLTYGGETRPIWTHNVTYVDNEVDFNWRINQTYILVECGRSDRPDRFLKVRITHSMPDFKELLIKINDGPWKPSKGRFTWHLRRGFNRLTSKTVNIWGIEGPESFVEVEYLEQPEFPIDWPLT